MPAYLQAMHWDDLQYFLAVARTGQHGRAARLLRVDATTVARRVRRLETEMGARLLEQGRDGQSLTGAGEALLAKAEEMERIAGSVHEASAGGQVAGRLRVSVSEGFGNAFVAPRLAGFASAHPRLAVDLAASSGFLNPSRRETDVAILISRPRRGPLITRKLTDYALGLYATRDYLARHGRPGDAAALGRHMLIGYIPDLIYSPELRYLDEIIPGLEPALRSSSIVAQAQLTAAGAGIAVLPRFMAETNADLVRVLPGRTIMRTFWLVTHSDMRDAPRVRAFADWMVAETAAARALLTGEPL